MTNVDALAGTSPQPPGPTHRADVSGDLLTYWRSRLVQHTQDSYAGIPMSKFPEDLRVYEHLLWEGRVTCVIEVGTSTGASALWFLDRLRAFRQHGRTEGDVRVISIDIDLKSAREHLVAVADVGHELTLIEHDVLQDGLAEAVAPHIPPNANVMLVEDGAHEEATTLAALEALAPLVSPGGWLVVEDGVVDDPALRIAEDWPRGVRPAITRWQGTPAASEFVARPDLELYGVTCHPGGFFQRAGGRAVSPGVPDLAQELASGVNWMYAWPLPDGSHTPVLMDELPLIHDTRLRAIEHPVREALAAAGSGARAIDLACSEGWFGQRLLDWGAGHVTGIDIRADNVRRAVVMAEAQGVPADRFDIRAGDVFDLSSDLLGTFDVVLLLGLIYHVEDPVGAIRNAYALTRPGGLCVVESQLTRQTEAVLHGWGRSDELEEADGSFALRVEEDIAANPVASFGGVVSLVPNAAALEASITAAGFRRQQWCEIPEDGSRQYVCGDRGLIAAWR